MELHAFLSRLRQMRFVDFDGFRDAGILADDANTTAMKWRLFQANPTEWLLKASDGDVEKLWAYLEDREPPGQIGGLPG